MLDAREGWRGTVLLDGEDISSRVEQIDPETGEIVLLDYPPRVDEDGWLVKYRQKVDPARLKIQARRER